MSRPRTQKPSAASRTLDIFAAPEKPATPTPAFTEARRQELHEVLPNPPPVRHHDPAPWTCQRCDQEKPQNRRLSLVAFDENGQSTGATIRLCAFCMATLATCLDKGTRLTPIYMPSAAPRRLRSPKRRPMPYAGLED